MKTALTLVAEISGLLIVFALFLLLLGYFKVITLPSFLPQITNSTTASIKNETINTIQTPIPIHFPSLVNEASGDQIQKFQANAGVFNAPQSLNNSDTYTMDAIFSGYDNKTIQVVTRDGILNLTINQSTLFEKQPNPATQTDSSASSGLVSGTIEYNTFADFSKEVVFGSTLQITYFKSTLTATELIYVASIPPIF
jgi:hypothetical protein